MSKNNIERKNDYKKFEEYILIIKKYTEEKKYLEELEENEKYELFNYIEEMGKLFYKYLKRSNNRYCVELMRKMIKLVEKELNVTCQINF